MSKVDAKDAGALINPYESDPFSAMAVLAAGADAYAQ